MRRMLVRSLGRRKFITVVGGAAVWPLAGHGEQPERICRVGVLLLWPENDPMARASVTAFAQALARFGWIEGKNIRIDYRFAAGDPNLFKIYAAELVGLMPDVLLAGASLAIAALREQSRTIPIVFVNVSDPLGQGFVESLARPGGNITGFTAYDVPLMGKWVQLLKEIAPNITQVIVIFNPDTAPYAASLNSAIEAAAPSFGITATFAPVHDDGGIEDAIAAHAREPGGGLIALPDTFNVAHRAVISTAAARHGLPGIGTPDFPRAGGLMSYSFDTVEVHAQGASYIDRILKGTSPAELPVQQPTKYSLAINLKTAKALGLTIPPAIFALADEVIE
jgi:putative ABC transport system substrate-binding protein